MVGIGCDETGLSHTKLKAFKAKSFGSYGAHPRGELLDKTVSCFYSPDGSACPGDSGAAA